MKKVLLMLVVMLGVSEIFAAPIKWHASGTAEIGRPKKGCAGLWICITVTDWGLGDEIKTKQGNPIGLEHGIGVGENGKLYLIINESLLSRNQPEKMQLLKGQSSYYLESDETVPQNVLDAIKYKGKNTISAGKKPITYERGFYFIQLN